MTDAIITRRGGGLVEIEFNNFKVYNDTVTRTTPTKLSQARYSLAGASVGDYALFAGGYSSPSYYATVDAYNSSLVRSTPTSLSVVKSSLAGASVGDYALFAGGFGSKYSNIVDAYDTSLTRTTPTGLSQARYSLAGASVGDYALFAGGSPDDSIGKNTVDAYTQLMINYQIIITKGSKYKLNSTTEIIAETNGTVIVNMPINGYIKYKKGVLE